MDKVQYYTGLTFSSTTQPTDSEVLQALKDWGEIIKNQMESKGFDYLENSYEYETLVALQVAISILSSDPDRIPKVEVLKELYEQIWDYFDAIIDNYYTENIDETELDWNFDDKY